MKLHFTSTAILGLVLSGAAQGQSVNPYTPGHLYWLMYGTHIFEIEQTPDYVPYSSAPGTGYFSNARSYVTGLGPQGQQTPNTVAPAGSLRTYIAANASNLAANLPQLLSTYGIQAIGYDAELWPNTPASEQADPAAAAAKLAALGAATGQFQSPDVPLDFVAALSPNLYQQIPPNIWSEKTVAPVTAIPLADATSYVPVTPVQINFRPGEPVITDLTIAGFLNYNFAGLTSAATSGLANSTIVILPFQDLVPYIKASDYSDLTPSIPTTSAPTFSQATRQAALQARAANANSKVLVELVADTSRVSLAQLKYAVSSTICSVDGYSLFVFQGTAPDANADLAGRLLQWMGQQAQTSRACPTP